MRQYVVNMGYNFFYETIMFLYYSAVCLLWHFVKAWYSFQYILSIFHFCMFLIFHVAIWLYICHSCTSTNLYVHSYFSILCVTEKRGWYAETHAVQKKTIFLAVSLARKHCDGLTEVGIKAFGATHQLLSKLSSWAPHLTAISLSNP